ncbi:hypothetical protein [Lentibacillus saliphilus]|uniref:hypothetical protein n=1 Tax=Lentibacillus saliphilus TaxID=2737028 RepID=UPI001C2FF7FF|nr:hypothetical protein [Lentibacillus saliphilus]
MRSFFYICGASLIYAVARCALARILLTQTQRPEGSHQTWTLPFGFWVAAGCGGAARAGYAAAWAVMRWRDQLYGAFFIYAWRFAYMRLDFRLCVPFLIYAAHHGYMRLLGILRLLLCLSINHPGYGTIR